MLSARVARPERKVRKSRTCPGSGCWSRAVGGRETPGAARVIAERLNPDSDMVRTTLLMPVALWKLAKVRAMDERRDLRAVLLDALRRYLADKEGSR